MCCMINKVQQTLLKSSGRILDSKTLHPTSQGMEQVWPGCGHSTTDSHCYLQNCHDCTRSPKPNAHILGAHRKVLDMYYVERRLLRNSLGILDGSLVSKIV